MQNIIDDKTLDVSQGIIHHSEGVDLLPSNIEMSGFEVRLINAMSRERVLKTYVNEVKKNYDYVLIDCMPSLGMITINALAAADSVIIPTQPHYLSAKGLELLLRSVSMVKRQINPKLRIDGILMTMVMPRTNISKEITATVKSAYGQKIKVFDTEIPHSIRAVEATAEGKSIFAYDRSGKVAAAYYDSSQQTIFVKKGLSEEVLFVSMAKEVSAAVYDFKYNESRDASDFKSFCVAYMVSSRYGVDTRGFDFSRLPREYAEMDTQAFKGELGTMRDVLGEIQSDMYKSMEKNKPAKNKEQER